MNRWISLLIMAGCTLGSAQAHRLTVDWTLTGNVLEIRATEGSEPAAGAAVRLRDNSDTPPADGELDEAGRFRLEWNGRAPLTIEVDAGLGHRRTLVLTEQDLRPPTSPAPAGPSPTPAPSAPSEGHLATGSSDAFFSQAARVVLGLTFLLALAAAWMSHRNTRRLTRLERRLDQHESRS